MHTQEVKHKMRISSSREPVFNPVLVGVRVAYLFNFQCCVFVFCLSWSCVLCT